jgi:hypothetical protein
MKIILVFISKCSTILLIYVSYCSIAMHIFPILELTNEHIVPSSNMRLVTHIISCGIPS